MKTIIFLGIIFLLATSFVTAKIYFIESDSGSTSSSETEIMYIALQEGETTTWNISAYPEETFNLVIT